MPVQLDFIVRGFAAAQRDPALRARQPYKAAHEGDLGWLGAAMVKHYQGDDGDLELLLGALAEGAAGVAVEGVCRQVAAFFEEAQHPKLGRPYRDCGFAPMVELLRHLEANGFLTFIVSGGDRDFMRPSRGDLRHPAASGRRLGLRDRLRRRRGRLHLDLESFDDGPQKPLHIWARTGRRPRSRAATPTATSRCCASPAVRASRPYGWSWPMTTPSARSTIAAAPSKVLGAGFTEISMRDDWATVFAG